MSMRYAAWLLMSEEDYGDYIEEEIYFEEKRDFDPEYNTEEDE